MAYPASAFSSESNHLPMMDRHVPAIPFVAGPINPPRPVTTEEPVRIKAYARLEFVGGVDFYIRTLGITIGRRPPGSAPPYETQSANNLKPEIEPPLSGVSPVLRPTSYTRSTSPAIADVEAEGEAGQAVVSTSTAHSDPPPAYTATPNAANTNDSDYVHVDVDLGQIKSISRDHARLFYDYSSAAWVLEVRGRNGVVVDGRWSAKGERVTLQHRTKIQIAEHIFYFVLPNMDSNQTGQSKPATNAVLGPSQTDSGDVSSEVSSSSEEEASPETDEVPKKRKPKTLTARRRLAALTYANDDDDNASSDVSQQPEVPQRPVKGSKGSAKAGFRARPMVGKGSKAKAPMKASALVNAERDEVLAKAVKVPRRGKVAKFKGKAKAESPPVELSSDGPKPTTSTEVAKVEPVAEPPRSPMKMPNNPHQGKPDKPPYSFASLIGQALTHAPDSKASRAHVIDWIAAAYPFFRESADEWQNTVRFTLAAGKVFSKVNKDDSGKGTLWTINPEYADQFDGMSFKKLKNAPLAAAPAPTTAPPPAEAATTTVAPADSVPSTSSSAPAAVPARPTPPVAAPQPAAPLRIPPGTKPTLKVGEPPDSYVRPEGNTVPPVVLHEDTLYLTQAIFGRLTSDQLTQLSRLDGPQALQILQAYVVRHFKEKDKEVPAKRKAEADDQSAPNKNAKVDSSVS